MVAMLLSQPFQASLEYKPALIAQQQLIWRRIHRFDPPVAFEPVLGLLGEINPFDEQRQVRSFMAPGQLQVLFDRVRLQRGVGAAAAARLCTV
jgi:hypothetical protein